MAERDQSRQHCPECGQPSITGEVSHFVQLPKYAGFPQGPLGAPQGAAATYTCAEGHEWTRDLPHRPRTA